MRQVTRLTSKLSAIVCATILAAAVSASAKEGETRTCKTSFGGQVVCGDLIIGITLEQYEAGLKKRAEEIRAEEAEKRIQLQKLVELTERATSAEKESLRSQIAAVEAEKRALEAESKGVADRQTNLQASYDGLVQKLAEANAALEAFAPLISKDAFEQAQAMLSRGDVLGAERKFVEIADTVRKIASRRMWSKRARSSRPVSWPRSGSTGAQLMLTMPAPRGCSQATGSTPKVPEDWRADGRLRYCRLIQRSGIEYRDLGIRPRGPRNCHGIEQPGDYVPIARALHGGRAALSAGHRDRRKGSRQGSSRRCIGYNNLACCFGPRASMTRPSRSIGGPSRSTKRFSARIIPTLRPVTTTSPLLTARASMTRPSRSIGGPSRSTKRFSARIIPRRDRVQQPRRFASGPGQV